MNLNDIKVRACSIQCIGHPEWGTWGVMDDCGGWYNIHGRSGGRVLDKAEAVTHWEIVKPTERK